MSNDPKEVTKRCPMPDEVCADCGYRCGEASPEEIAAAGAWGRTIWERVKEKTDGR